MLRALNSHSVPRDSRTPAYCALGYHTADSRPLSGSRCGAPLLGRLAGLTEKVPVFGQLLLEEVSDVLSEGLFLLCDCDVQSGPAAVPPLG